MKGSYNHALVAFSILIAVVASYTALALSARVQAERREFRAAWLAGGSVAMGMGIWSMHFVGMLAYRLPVPITYDVPLWLLSMILAVAGCAVALWIGGRTPPSRPILVAACLVVGAAFTGMQFVGMAAMRLPGRVDYDPPLAVVSVTLALAAAAAALRVFAPTRGGDSWGARRLQKSAAVVLGAAMVGMQYTAMASARFTLRPAALVVPDGLVLQTEGLGAGVIVDTLLLLGITLLAVVVDRRMRVREAEAEVVRRSEARFRSLVVASAQVVWTADPQGRFHGQQPGLAAHTGLTPDHYGGWGWLQAVHPDDRARVESTWRLALKQRHVAEIEFRLRQVDGTWRRLNVRAVPVLEENGDVREWVGATTDVTERRRVEEARDLLVDASRVLASSLDYTKTLQTVAGLAVPLMADWCAVDVLMEDGQLKRLAVYHSDPERVQLAKMIDARWPARMDAPSGQANVVRTGRPELVPRITDEILAERSHNAEHLRQLRALGLWSYIIVPLVARGAVMGTLTLVYAESGRVYGEKDLRVAEELARRAAVAIDNARLFGETEEARAQLEQQTGELEEAQAAMEVAHDELRRAYEELAERTHDAESARAAADEANAAKSAFLATMSHELRTPLNAIAGYTQLLEMGIHGEVTEAQRDALEKIRRNQEHLLGLINDVLNFARIEAGQVRYTMEDVKLDPMLSAVEDLVEPQVRARGLQYHYRRGDPTVTVRADRERVEQIILNLLTNAIKFTEPGGRVELSWDTEGQRAQIHVADTGRGIPSDRLEAIFEPFVQVDPALTRASDGTGLGLSISRDLARAMGGDLTARSTEGKGSVFTLTLPLGEPATASAATSDEDALGTKEERKPIVSTDAPGKETSGREVPSKDVPGQEAPDKKAPGKGVPSKEAPGQEAPDSKAPGKGVPSKEAPGQEAPDNKAPGKGVPSKEAPGQEAPDKKAPGKDVPSKEAPGQEAPGKGVPSKEAPSREAPGKQAPGKDVPSRDAPGQEPPDQDAPGKDVPGQDAPGMDAPGMDAPGGDVTSRDAAA